MELFYTKKDYDQNKEIIKSKLVGNENYTYIDMHQYFKSKPTEVIEKMLGIIDGKSKISLRILDWFVTKYSNEHKTCYPLDDIDDDIGFTVHIGYKAQLKTYKKVYFDPFRRYKKFFYYYQVGDKYKRFETTLGQLNFFKWAFEKKVIEYVEKNFTDLVKAMNVSNKEDKERKKKKKIQKGITESSTTPISSESSYSSSQTESNISPKNTTRNNAMEIVLSFD
ncbi:MAG: hypothetical protein CMF62_01435 [Magnetococcales bacterium]|nr:hypothetical protein [Magnetococcales bacterium]|tara:strand:- start:13312 stop:13980 length:669 start_codon:yes stop_codon:yes gene_type:complete